MLVTIPFRCRVVSVQWLYTATWSGPHRAMSNSTVSEVKTANSVGSYAWISCHTPRLLFQATIPTSTPVMRSYKSGDPSVHPGVSAPQLVMLSSWDPDSLGDDTLLTDTSPALDERDSISCLQSLRPLLHALCGGTTPYMDVPSKLK